MKFQNVPSAGIDLSALSAAFLSCGLKKAEKGLDAFAAYIGQLCRTASGADRLTLSPHPDRQSDVAPMLHGVLASGNVEGGMNEC
jgi:hypothetical protein